MTLIRQLGISLLVIILFSSSCNNQPMDVIFSEVEAVDIKNFNTVFAEYSGMDFAKNFELNAVLCSFVGDHKNAIEFATKDAHYSQNPELNFGLNDAQMILAKKNYEAILKDPNASDEVKVEAHKILSLLNHSKDLKEVFKEQKMLSAKDFIVDQSKDYHFLLINEAHYSSQNRAFTNTLLYPLWKKGYRYLALETLGYDDQMLSERGYPIAISGYYTRDAVFGNLVREALQIGYKLIAYEYSSLNGTLRDSIQALNIYDKTLRRDTIGKVLVHAGYSHISEMGDSNYKPMGLQLKKLIGRDILTVDQQNMTQMTDNSKMASYYIYAIDHYTINQPVVFTDDNKQALVDPINSFAIDIQVYHPFTTYIKGRPSWLITNNTKLFELPASIKKHNGYLLQVLRKGDIQEAVPIDQFVIDQETALVLSKGEYIFRLIDRDGSLKWKGNLKIN